MGRTPTPDQRARRRRRTSALLTALLLPLLGGLLGGLLVLQARWLDELADAQREQTRRMLASAAERIASELQSALGDLEREIASDTGTFDLARAPLVAEIAALTEDAQVPRDVPSFDVWTAAGERLLVLLDVERLRDDLFPLLARRALGEEALEHYRVAVVPTRPGAPLLYGSPADTPPDATADIALLPSRWFADDGATWVDLPGPIFVATASAADGAALEPSWRVEIRHRSGSLEGVLARARMRNALLGAALLLLMVAGLAFLWVAEQRARRLAEAELAFVAGVSHELRTPLAVMRTAASNLESGVVSGPERVAEYGALIESEATRLGALVERVLRFSHDQEDAPVRGPVDVEAWITDSVALCMPWRDRRRFDVRVDITPRTATVEGDRGALTSALQNLIENAIKYGEDGQTVRVVARSDEDLRVDVVNSGDGILPADRERLFEPFFRGTNARAAGVPGSGLGLAVARAVALAHGGSLELATSEREVTFTLRLPRRVT